MSTAKNVAKLRVVLDSNVFISAFTHPQGRLFQVWRQAVLGQYRLLVSPAIVNEVGEVLRVKFGWPDAQVTARLKLLVKVAEIVTPTEALLVIKDDPDDNRILECAVAGRADLIVSADHHVRRLKSYQGIGIASPTDFVRTLGV
jgi:putative PIN family toxin of toxin-antitoxin system